MKAADFADQTKAEQKLIAHLQSGAGGFCIIGIEVPPENAPDDLHIRTSLIRALILDQVEDVPLPERGLRIAGAYLRGDGPADGVTRGLDLEGADLSRDLALVYCRIPERILLRSACVRNLFLNGSVLPEGMQADGLEAKGDVFLRDVTAAGEVRLAGARLGGGLDCTGARLNAPGHALVADGLEAKGDVFLRDVSAAGEVRLAGARLGGDLDCNGARLNGPNDSLTCTSARIAGSWFWRKGASSKGALILEGAEIGTINDDPACWPPELRLDRCRYGAFTGQGVSAAERIDWLSRLKPRKYGDDFWPQPYEECARALREAGHGADARAVLIEKERLQRDARRRVLADELDKWRRKRDEAPNDSGIRPYTDRVIGAWLRLRVAAVWDFVLAEAVSYGRRPGKAAVWLGAFLLLGWLIFARAAGFGEIKPNLPQIQRQAEWVHCADDPRGQLDCFLARPEAASYPRFNALIYSADTLLPIVSLEMQSYWIPDDRKPIGAFARFYLWVHIFAGWGLTLLAVAGFSGLIKTDNTT